MLLLSVKVCYYYRLDSIAVSLSTARSKYLFWYWDKGLVYLMPVFRYERMRMKFCSRKAFGHKGMMGVGQLWSDTRGNNVFAFVFVFVFVFYKEGFWAQRDDGGLERYTTSRHRGIGDNRVKIPAARAWNVSLLGGVLVSLGLVEIIWWEDQWSKLLTDLVWYLFWGERWNGHNLFFFTFFLLLTRANRPLYFSKLYFLKLYFLKCIWL